MLRKLGIWGAGGGFGAPAALVACTVVSTVALVACFGAFCVSFSNVVQRSYFVTVTPSIATAAESAILQQELTPDASSPQEPAAAGRAVEGNGVALAGGGAATSASSHSGLFQQVARATSQVGSVSRSEETAADAASSSQSADTPKQDASSNDGSTDGAVNGSASSDMGYTEPSAPAISADQEAQYLQQITAHYNKLGSYYDIINSGWNSFVAEAHASSDLTRYANFERYTQVSYEEEVDQVKFIDIQVPQNSIHYQSFLDVQELYSYVGNAGALLAQAWRRCWYNFDDEEDWMTPFNVNSSGGRITYLANFEARYPELRPR